MIPYRGVVAATGMVVVAPARLQKAEARQHRPTSEETTAIGMHARFSCQAEATSHFWRHETHFSLKQHP